MCLQYKSYLIAIKMKKISKNQTLIFCYQLCFKDSQLIISRRLFYNLTINRPSLPKKLTYRYYLCKIFRGELWKELQSNALYNVYKNSYSKFQCDFISINSLEFHSESLLWTLPMNKAQIKINKHSFHINSFYLLIFFKT